MTIDEVLMRMRREINGVAMFAEADVVEHAILELRRAQRESHDRGVAYGQKVIVDEIRQIIHRWLDTNELDDGAAMLEIIRLSRRHNQIESQT